MEISMKDRKTSPTAITPEGTKFLKRRVLLLSVGACSLRLLLVVIHEIMLVNLGASSLAVSLVGYFTEAFTACALFSLVAVAVYAKLIGQDGVFAYAIVMQGLSMLLISSLLNMFVIWFMTVINDSDLMSGAAFEISNYTTAMLTGEQVIYLLSMSFISIAVIMVMLLIFIPVMRAAKKKALAANIELSIDALAEKKWSDSPARLPSVLFIAIFVGVSLISRIIDTVSTLTSGDPPRTAGDYIVLGTPYFTLVIFAAAGALAMQFAYERIAKRMKSVCGK